MAQGQRVAELVRQKAHELGAILEFIDIYFPLPAVLHVQALFESFAPRVAHGIVIFHRQVEFFGERIELRDQSVHFFCGLVNCSLRLLQVGRFRLECLAFFLELVKFPLRRAAFIVPIFYFRLVSILALVERLDVRIQTVFVSLILPPERFELGAEGIIGFLILFQDRADASELRCGCLPVII